MQKCNIMRFPEPTSKGQLGSGAPCDDLTIKLFFRSPVRIQTVLMCEPERCSGGSKAHPHLQLLPAVAGCHNS